MAGPGLRVLPTCRACMLPLLLLLLLAPRRGAGAVLATMQVHVDDLNNNGRDANGEKCDLDLFGLGYCDPYFSVCIARHFADVNPSSWKDSSKFDACLRQARSVYQSDRAGSLATEVIVGSFEFTDEEFPDGLPCLAIGWQIYDYDSQNSDDLMMADAFDLCTDADTDGNLVLADDQWHKFNRARSDFDGSVMSWRVRVSCGPNRGGLMCENYCEAPDPSYKYQCRNGEHVCLNGWEGDVCDQDIDACVNNPCPMHATCEDLKCPENDFCSFMDNAMGRTCNCSLGFELQGSTCTNINACHNHPCHPEATCQDLPPPAPDSRDGRTCTCNKGFEGDGDTCSDENECDTLAETGCNINAQCINTAGGFSCRCRTGYQGSGTECMSVCGDSIVVVEEQCDDGNQINGDGCSAGCFMEPGWSCLGAGPGSCKPLCGDGTRVGDEACDDGATVDGDGCSRICTVEVGYSCAGAGPKSCRGICGDGLVVIGEQCDTGENVTDDGCDECRTAFGFRCLGQGPGSCQAVCGDDFVVGGEECDDGNLRNGDGCSDKCAVEVGWVCNQRGCSPVCGDGLLTGTEECDDGNLVAHDGCSPECTVEDGFVCKGQGPGSCSDWNECDGSPCHAHASCTNTFGSFTCTCWTGYVGDGVKRCAADCGTLEDEAARFLVGQEYLSANCTGNSTLSDDDVACTLSCASDFHVIIPSGEFRCRPTGYWIGTAPTCIRLKDLPTQLFWTQNTKVEFKVPARAGNWKEVHVFFSNIPPGLVAQPEGLTGRPSEVGNFTIMYAVENADGILQHLPSVNVTVSPKMTSSHATMYAVEGRFFELSSRTVSGGRAPLSYQVVEGQLPEGILFNNHTGVLAGTADATGYFEGITFAVTDANGAQLMFEPFAIQVGKPLAIDWNRKDGKHSVVVSRPCLIEPPEYKILHSNGKVTFHVFSGMPPGLQVNENTGIISGVPTTTGNFTSTIVATDEANEAVALQTNHIEVSLPTDCSQASNGPNGRGCGSGQCVDAVAFDGRFTCSCKGTKFTGENCDVLQRSDQPSSNSSSNHMLIAIISVSCGLAVMAVLVVLVYLRRRRRAILQEIAPPYVPPPVDDWEFDRKRLVFGHRLGQGDFGVVHAGVAYDIRQSTGPTQVAIKQCLPERAAYEHKKAFVEEAKLMKRLDHPNVTRLLGVCLQEEPLLLISELMEYGALKGFLRSNPGLGEMRLLQFCLDVARGVEYIASQKVVHRDLAARNCLVSSSFCVKLADFGLGRDTAYKNYYRLKSEAYLPVRWTAPECLKTGDFSAQSDVWALGVVFWEIFARGEVPYAGMENMQVFHHVEAGNRLDRPSACPNTVYDVMLQCWQADVRQRCTATDVLSTLEGLAAATTPEFRSDLPPSNPFASFDESDTESPPNSRGYHFLNPLYDGACSSTEGSRQDAIELGRTRMGDSDV